MKQEQQIKEEEEAEKKRKRESKKSEKKLVPRSIDISNVAYYDEKTQQCAKIKYVIESNIKYRVNAKTQEKINIVRKYPVKNIENNNPTNKEVENEQK